MTTKAKIYIALIILIMVWSYCANAIEVRHIDFVGNKIIIELADTSIITYNLSKSEMKSIQKDSDAQDALVDRILNDLRQGHLPSNMDPNLRSGK